VRTANRDALTISDLCDHQWQAQPAEEGFDAGHRPRTHRKVLVIVLRRVDRGVLAQRSIATAAGHPHCSLKSSADFNLSFRPPPLRFGVDTAVGTQPGTLYGAVPEVIERPAVFHRDRIHGDQPTRQGFIKDEYLSLDVAGAIGGVRRASLPFGNRADCRFDPAD